MGSSIKAVSPWATAKCILWSSNTSAIWLKFDVSTFTFHFLSTAYTNWIVSHLSVHFFFFFKNHLDNSSCCVSCHLVRFCKRVKDARRRLLVLSSWWTWTSGGRGGYDVIRCFDSRASSSPPPLSFHHQMCLESRRWWSREPLPYCSPSYESLIENIDTDDVVIISISIYLQCSHLEQVVIRDVRY